MHKNHTVLLLSVLVIFLGLYVVIMSGHYWALVRQVAADKTALSSSAKSK